MNYKKMNTHIDAIDAVKFNRMACRAGLTTSEALRILATEGVAFFLALTVGATTR